MRNIIDMDVLHALRTMPEYATIAEVQKTITKHKYCYATLRQALDRLEKEYTLIKKVKPIFAKEGSRTLKYEIIDNFFHFWFRFIYKNRSAIEIENYAYVRSIVVRDFETYSGRFLEKYFIEKLKASGQFSTIGTYWEKGNQNEIDIVAVNEHEKKILIAEVKRNPEKIHLELLRKKAHKLLQKHQGYRVVFKGYSLRDIRKQDLL